MPYIKPERREVLNNYIVDLSTQINPDIGELNYVITKLCINYIYRSDKKYTDYNAIIGVLECAKQEFYRRQVAAYEDKKIDENGDVY